MATDGSICVEKSESDPRCWLEMLEQISQVMGPDQEWDDCLRLATTSVFTMGIPLLDSNPAFQAMLLKHRNVVDPVQVMGNTFFAIKGVLSRDDLSAKDKCARVKVYIKFMMAKCQLVELPRARHYTMQNCMDFANNLATQMMQLTGHEPPIFFQTDDDTQTARASTGGVAPFSGVGFKLREHATPPPPSSTAAGPVAPALDKNWQKILMMDEISEDEIMRQLVEDAEKHELREMILEHIERLKGYFDTDRSVEEMTAFIQLLLPGMTHSGL